ncbi:hypothetical protein D3C78_1085920 [compost metagenome]
MLIVLGKAAKEGEKGEPQHRQLQGAHATDAVGEDTGDPATQGRCNQGTGVNQAGFGGGDTPQGDQRGDNKAEHLGVHAIQAVADLAAPESPTFLFVDVAVPVERSRHRTGFDLLLHARWVHGCLSLLVLF